MSFSNPSYRLTAAQIGAIKPGPQVRDMSDPGVPGLVLRIYPSGWKSWLFRYMWNGSSSRISLGKFPGLSLADARKLAMQQRDLLESGIDPRRAARSHSKARSGRQQPITKLHCAQEAQNTIDEIPQPTPDDKHSVLFLAYEYVKHYVKPNRESAKEVVGILKKDVLPKWRDRDARTISAREVIELLDGIVERGARVMANRTADILAQLFKYGIHRQACASGPKRSSQPR